MRVSIREIQREVARDFDVAPEKMLARSQLWEVSHPRQYAMLLARELTPHSTVVIGKLFDRDHSTIVHGIRAAKKRVAKDRNLALKLEARALALKSRRIPELAL